MSESDNDRDDQADTILATAVIAPKHPDDPAVLAAFVRELQGRNVRVGGLLQFITQNEVGRPISLYAEEIDTGRQISLMRPDKEIKGPSDCVLELSALAETAGALRRAITECADLVVIEKFGKEEAAGRGLLDDIMKVVASGLPALVLLPQAYVEQWNQFTGGIVETITFDADALNQWWGKITKHK